MARGWLETCATPSFDAVVPCVVGGMRPGVSLYHLPYPHSYATSSTSGFAIITGLRRRMSYRSSAGSRRTENILSTSLHVSDEIREFFRASHTFGFSIALRRAAKILYLLVRLVGGRRGSHVHLRRYLMCFPSVVLQRHSNIMLCPELCLGSCTDTFLKRR